MGRGILSSCFHAPSMPLFLLAVCVSSLSSLVESSNANSGLLTTKTRTTNANVDQPQRNDVRQAFLEMIFYSEDEGFFTASKQLRGRVANCGNHFTTEGRIVKINLNDICNSDDVHAPKQPFGWIAYIEVNSPPTPPSPTTEGRRRNRTDKKREHCLSTVAKVEQIVDRGAKAIVISDNADSENFYEQLKSLKTIKPVVMVTSVDSHQIRRLVHRRQKNFIRIKARALPHKISVIHEDMKRNEYFDMGIFLSFFIIVLLLCLVLLVKLKRRQNRKKNVRVKIAVEALKDMTVRKNNVSRDCHVTIDGNNPDEQNSFGINTCTICLDELNDGKDIRILPCHHEFHQTCIDPWLIANFTCPLCMYSIIETKKLSVKSQGCRLTRFISRRLADNQHHNDLTQAVDSAIDDGETRLSHTLSTPVAITTTETESVVSYDESLSHPHQQQQRQQKQQHQTPRFHTCPFHNNKRRTKSTNSATNSNTMSLEQDAPNLECSGQPHLNLTTPNNKQHGTDLNIDEQQPLLCRIDITEQNYDQTACDPMSQTSNGCGVTYDVSRDVDKQSKISRVNIKNEKTLLLLSRTKETCKNTSSNSRQLPCIVCAEMTTDEGVQEKFL